MEYNTLDRLAKRLRSERELRLCQHFIDLFKDVHLKDLIAHDMDDDRRMRVDGHLLYNFGSDSYLGLDRDRAVRQAMIDAAGRWGLHNGASRIFYSVELCAEAERRLAAWLGTEDALIFPSVTLANMGLVPGIVGKGDILVVDREAHNSVHEGAKIAVANGVTHRELYPCRADTLRHILDREEYAGCVLAVDGLYSMTGTSPPLESLDEAVRSYGGTLYVDDAHSIGVVGAQGRGAANDALGGLDQVLMVGSLSKAFSCMGAFVTCTQELKPLLKMKSNTYIFGGPVPPPYLAAVCAVCDILASTRYDGLIGQLRRQIRRVADGIRSIGLIVIGGETPTLAIPIGSIERTLLAGKWLFDRGYYVPSVTYPAVPIHEGLLRIQVNANHTDEAVDGLLNVLSDLKDNINDFDVRTA